MRTGQDATRPDAVWVEGMKSESADVFPGDPSGGENVTTRKRGRPEKDALLDSNHMTGSQQDRRDELPQDDIGSGQDRGRGGQEPLGDVFPAAPSSGEMPTAPPGALDTNSHSQPAWCSAHDK